MTDEELERRLRNWYRDDIPADETAPIALRASLEAIPGASLVRGRRITSRRAATLLAAAALVGLLAATAVIGGFPRTRPVPSVVPSQLPSALPSALQSSQPSIAPAKGRIIYTRWRLLVDGEEDCDPPGKLGHCRRASIFTSNADGSNERQLFPEPSSNLIAASPDGSRLIVSIIGPEGDNLYLTDINGSQPHLIDTNCVNPCLGDGEFAFSPDGSRLAFSRGIARAGTSDQIGTVIAIMDLATGTVVQLDSTYASNPDLGDPCHSNCGEGENRGPSWSPDGEHLLFPRTDIGIPNAPLSRKRFFNDKTVFVVDVDGRNLRQLTSKKLYIRSASWSPDGSLIVLTRSRDTLAAPGVDNWQELNDIYVVRPDGTGLQRLTTDTVAPVETLDPGEFGARFPSWTREGRIVFIRNPGQGETVYQLWVMNSDSTNATRLDPSDPAALTAIGCISCPYPGVDPFVTGRPSIAFWISGP
jgi:Tol biopolymer transport system component